MKQQIKAIARRWSRWPVVGRGVHIVAAIYHLPRLRAQIDSTQTRLLEVESTALAKLSIMSDTSARLSKRMQSVEKTAIGLLTAITTEVGELKGELSSLKVEVSTGGERLNALDVTIGMRLESFIDGQEVQWTDFARMCSKFDADMGRLREELVKASGHAEGRMDSIRSALAQTSVDFDARLEALQREIGETTTVISVPDVSAVEAKFEEVSEIVANLTRSMPVVLREIRRDQLRLQATLVSGGSLTEMPSSTAALDDLQATADEQEGRVTDLLRSTVAALTSRLEGDEVAQQTTAQQVQQFTDTLTFLVGRIEFVRRELMFEMRYGVNRDTSSSEGLEIEPRIVATEKVAQARAEGLRLNLGCGHVALPGYVNVDRRELPGVDVVAEVSRLPFDPGEVEFIMSSHVLEHFPQEQLRRELLPYWHNLLRAGGRFRAVVPDAKAMLAHYANGDYAYEDMREVIYGAQDYEGDFHYNMFTPESLKDLLVATGFSEVYVEDRGRKSGQSYEFDISATKA